jgi:phosphorylcholine metabolism protein LicD
MTIAQQFKDKNIKYLDYDFIARKQRREEKIDKKIAKENLLLFRDIFYKNGINFFLLYGTVLGAIREKDFIEHDTDTDIGIFEKDREKLLKIIPILLENGFELIRTKAPDDLVTFMKNDEYIDIGIFRLEKDNYRYQNNFISKKYLEELDVISFLEYDFFIPINIKKLLKEWYGSDWMIPYKNEPAMEGTKLDKFISKIKRIILRNKTFQKNKHIIKKILGKK